MLVSSTSMNVAIQTATAISHGLTAGREAEGFVEALSSLIVLVPLGRMPHGPAHSRPDTTSLTP
jgi:hypothetical protein